MSIETIRQALRSNGLVRLAEQAERLVKPAIHIEPDITPESSMPVGTSKIGGRPDLPSDTSWPTRDGRPLGFLSQFNLADIADFDVYQGLPQAGLLSFFYDFQTSSWGLKPEDRGGWQVLYFESDHANLTRADWPESLTETFRLPAQRPTFTRVLTLTDEPEWVLPESQLTLEEAELYRKVVPAHARAGRGGLDEGADNEYDYLATRHQLLGYPTHVHYGRMPFECECLVGRRATPIFEDIRYSWDADQEARARPDITQAYRSWQLLFQLGNISGLPFPHGYEDDDDPGWRLNDLSNIWARGGLMYFWIERDRLATRDFSNVWLLGASQL